MKYLQLAASCMIAVSCLGCEMKPLKSELVGFPRVISNQEKVSFTIRLRNRSPISQPIPTEFEVRHCAAFGFIPENGPNSSTEYSHLYAVTGIDLCPPTCEVISAFGSRDYEFQWQPPKNSKGKGVFVVRLEGTLPKIEPFAVKIE